MILITNAMELSKLLILAMVPQASQLTPENLKCLPIAPPNLDTYVADHRDFEVTSMGNRTSRRDMVEVLRAWDRRWEDASRT